MIKDHFISSKKTLLEAKPFIVFTLAVFVLTSALGVVFYRELLPFILPILEKIVDELKGASFLETFAFIYSNNLLATIIALLSGIALGIFPLLSLVANSLMLGAVLAHTHETLGSSHWWQLIPHGIFELPAFFIAVGLGFYVCGSLFHEHRLSLLQNRLLASLKTYAFWVIPLLFIAAIIETYLIFF